MHPRSPLVSEGRLPVLWREGAEVVLVRHPGQPGEDVLQVRQGVLAAAFAGDDERVQDRRALPGVGVADKEPVSQIMQDYAHPPPATPNLTSAKRTRSRGRFSCDDHLASVSVLIPSRRANCSIVSPLERYASTSSARRAA